MGEIYRVYGSKTKYYYSDVNAMDAAAAWDFASNNDNIDWFEVETDDVIEPYNVSDSVQLTEYSKQGTELPVTENI